jgi:cytochrome c oxidase assembly protein subunit 11
MMPSDLEERRAENRSMLRRLVVVAAAMFGFGFAMVPFYNHICRALGLDNLSTVRASEPRNTQIDMSRTVTVEFDANTHELPWRFRPLERHVSIHPGELVQVEFEVVNVRNHAVTGQAVPSFGPQRAGQFFRKTECFCFTQQTLAAEETRRMPVVFTVDPSLPKDINTITLSYTFFEVAGKGNGA